jgi:hypothetical protein
MKSESKTKRIKMPYTEKRRVLWEKRCRVCLGTGKSLPFKTVYNIVQKNASNCLILSILNIDNSVYYLFTIKQALEINKI